MSCSPPVLRTPRLRPREGPRPPRWEHQACEPTLSPGPLVLQLLPLPLQSPGSRKEGRAGGPDEREPHSTPPHLEPKFSGAVFPASAPPPLASLFREGASAPPTHWAVIGWKHPGMWAELPPRAAEKQQMRLMDKDPDIIQGDRHCDFPSLDSGQIFYKILVWVLWNSRCGSVITNLT